MKKVKWWLDPQLSGELFEGEFDVEDDTTEEENIYLKLGRAVDEGNIEDILKPEF